MTCKPELLQSVPLFSLLDDDETAVLASQVDVKTFAARERIYKAGDPGMAYVMVSGRVRVTTVDEDQQEVVVDEPAHGEFFGFASMLEQTPHQTSASALEESTCLEVSRDDISTLLQRKPQAGMDLLTTLGHQFHAAHQLVRLRATRNPNEIIEKEMTTGERIADVVAGFGGSWTFIITFAVDPDDLHAGQHHPRRQSVGSLPVYPAQPVSVHARGHPGSGHHDEPEPAGHQRPAARRTRLRRQSSRRIRDPGNVTEIERAR